MQPLLVLWDVDYTLADTAGVGRRLYEIVLEELYGLAMPRLIKSMAGRTDSAIALEVLIAAGVPDAAAQVGRFQDVLAARAPELEGLVRERGKALPGAAEVLATLAEPRYAGQVVQSLLTGNVPALARVKLGALGLIDHLDLSIGAYGDVSAVRSDLVPVARQNAADRYGTDFAGRATVLVGDTPNDVRAATVNGARSVAVATGSFTGEQLADAGADIVLADLTDTAQVVSAILDGASGD
ncbi:MAG TPA: HAD hydrolase-like protein [Chloroflexota bacterium]